MKRFGLLSIRMLVALVLMLPIAVTATVLLATLTVTSQQMGESMAQTLLGEAVDRVRVEVGGYLNQAVRASEVYARRIQDGVLGEEVFHDWQRALRDDLTSLPAVASICYGNETGKAVWLLRDEGDWSSAWPRKISSRRGGSTRFPESSSIPSRATFLTTRASGRGIDPP